MFPLPTHWHATKGIFYGVAQADCGYTAYCTNFHHAWVENCPHNVVLERARAAGIDDVSRDHIHQLVALAAAAFVPPEGIFEGLGPLETVELTVELDSNVKWTFCLTKMASSETLLKHINYQQFANHNYWAHKVGVLELLLEAKDRYTDYLLQNFKDVNHELAAKYRRTHRGETEAIDKFERSEWGARIHESYASKLTKRRFARKDPQQRVWMLIDDAIRRPAEWDYANLFLEAEQADTHHLFLPFDDVMLLPTKPTRERKRRRLLSDEPPSRALSPETTKFKRKVSSPISSEIVSWSAKKDLNSLFSPQKASETIKSKSDSKLLPSEDAFVPLDFLQPSLDLSPTKKSLSAPSSQLLPRKLKRLGVYKHRKR